jgi:NADPH2:quinone reductase
MARVRAAILREHGSIPELGEWPEPAGGGAEVLAAALNPVDLRIASGSFYGGSPDPPYVPGSEAIVRHGAGRAYAVAAGAFAERVALGDVVVPVPDGVDDGLALACGTAGSTALAALERGRLAEGESVLVLGARGAVGALALQLASLLGAGRVVGASRTPPPGGIRLEEIEESGPFDLVVDPLWGAPAQAAARALAPGGRLVGLGESAGAEATFPSALVRGRQLEILGLALPARGPQRRRALYERLMEWAAAGRLRAKTEEFPLDRVAEAWERQAASPGAKLLLRP